MLYISVIRQVHLGGMCSAHKLQSLMNLGNPLHKLQNFAL